MVTARRRSENLQAVPIAVTSVSGADLMKQHVTQLTGIASTSPNTLITPSVQTPAAPVIGIRGQAQTDLVATIDTSVGIYVDGVYWSRPFGANASLVDIQDVEVLKGPQGTLFGRNTTGGALNITTGNVNLRQYSGLVSATGGSYGRWTALWC